MSKVDDIPLDLLRRALKFYSMDPTGQYDSDVVVPVLEAELARREAKIAGVLHPICDHPEENPVNTGRSTPLVTACSDI